MEAIRIASGCFAETFMRKNTAVDAKYIASEAMHIAALRFLIRVLSLCKKVVSMCKKVEAVDNRLVRSAGKTLRFLKRVMNAAPKTDAIAAKAMRMRIRAMYILKVFVTFHSAALSNHCTTESKH